MSITGPKSRENFAINGCVGIDCAVRDQRCHECVKINGKYTEFVPSEKFFASEGEIHQPIAERAY